MNGLLGTIILRLLESRQSSGYEIAKRIKSKTGYKPSFGSIYPVLEKLEKKNIVNYEKDGRKKIYFLTKKGEKEAKKVKKKRNKFIKEIIKELNLHKVFFADEEKTEKNINEAARILDKVVKRGGK